MSDQTCPRCASDHIDRQHTVDGDYAGVCLACDHAWIESDVSALRRSESEAREREAKLREAADGLIAFIRSKYPDDFKPGGRGYLCPHHIALDAALTVKE